MIYNINIINNHIFQIVSEKLSTALCQKGLLAPIIILTKCSGLSVCLLKQSQLS